nr:hypothetical protein BaRGS_016092 [Batillaria attramentaria]
MLKIPKKPATGRRQPPKGQLKKSEEVLSHIQQLQETAQLILGEQAASRVHLHDNLMQDGAVDRLVATLTARPTSDVCLIADEAEGFGPFFLSLSVSLPLFL